MNDLEKAKLLIENKNNSLVDISRKYNIPVQTLRNLRHDPSKMKKRVGSEFICLHKYMTNNLLRKNKCPLKGAKKGHKFGSTRRKLILVDTIQKAYNTVISIQVQLYQ